MKFKVVVTPKKAVLDPQGNAVRDAMRHLGMPEVQKVRIGKYMEIELGGEDVDLEKRLHALCRDLLSNPVIEDYELQKDGAKVDATPPSRAQARNAITGKRRQVTTQKVKSGTAKSRRAITKWKSNSKSKRKRKSSK